MTLDLTKVTALEFEGIDRKDYPDFCDAYVVKALYMGEEMTEEQLEELNEERDFIHGKLLEHLY